LRGQAVSEDERVLSDVGFGVQDVKDRVFGSFTLDDFPIWGIVFSEDNGEAGLVAGDCVDASGDPSDLLDPLAISLLDVPLVAICPAGEIGILGDRRSRADGRFHSGISEIFVL
jgi:hypothetical protein